MKLNCWEFKNCGREPNGVNVKEFGVCAAAKEIRVNGVNSGKNGGRSCWAISGTLCDGEIQGTFAMKVSNCSVCDFYKVVSSEERKSNTYAQASVIIKQIN